MTILPLLLMLFLFLTGCAIPFLKSTKMVLSTSLAVHGITAALMAVSVPVMLSIGPTTFSLGAPETLNGMFWSFGPVETLMAAVFSTIAALILWSSAASITQEITEARMPLFILLFHLIHGSILGIVLTGQLFNAFILLEIIGLASAALIAIKDHEENLKAAMKYLIFSTLGSGLVLMGIVCLYAPTGFLTFLKLQNVLPALMESHPNVVTLSFAFFITGLGIKGALFPLHIWLPDAHSVAATPASALLSSLVIKAPPFLLIKLVTLVYSPILPSLSLIMNILAGTAAAGIIIASVLARSEHQIKRMLAYSSVSQIGYVFLAIGLGTPAAIVVALYHMIAHGLAKACLFLTAGLFINETGCHDMKEFKGIGKEMPYTLGLFTLSALSMVGIPILPGFISKFSLAMASIHSGKLIVLAVILLSSLLTALYYFPIIINGYFGEENLRDRLLNSRVRSFRDLLPLFSLSFLMILAGFLSGHVLEILKLGLYSG